MKTEIDKIILGDNQFFGVNHMSEAHGMETRNRFKDINEIKKVMYDAMELGATGCFFSTHPDISMIADMIRNDSTLRDHYNLYINVPYIVKYVSMFNTMGLTGILQTMLKEKTKSQSLNFLAAGAKNFISQDYINMALQLVEIEMQPFQGLKVKAILLHDSLCDLALAYDMKDVICRFDTYIREKYHCIPGYGTKNYPLFSEFLKRANIENPFIMTAINKLGFYMNPGREKYENALHNNYDTVLAMASLASGRLRPDEAYEYLASIGIKNVVVGLSSREHAEETFASINKYLVTM